MYKLTEIHLDYLRKCVEHCQVSTPSGTSEKQCRVKKFWRNAKKISKGDF